jgi:hypothetical protein
MFLKVGFTFLGRTDLFWDILGQKGDGTGPGDPLWE